MFASSSPHIGREDGKSVKRVHILFYFKLVVGNDFLRSWLFGNPAHPRLLTALNRLSMKTDPAP